MEWCCRTCPQSSHIRLARRRGLPQSKSTSILKALSLISITATFFRTTLLEISRRVLRETKQRVTLVFVSSLRLGIHLNDSRSKRSLDRAFPHLISLVHSLSLAASLLLCSSTTWSICQHSTPRSPYKTPLYRHHSEADSSRWPCQRELSRRPSG